MIPGIHNYSEIGKLNKVLLHRPGLELEALTPSTMERLLFDDIPFLKVAQEEHDRFAEVLRENGVEVVYYVQETAKALSTPKLQQSLIEDFLDLSLGRHGADVRAAGGICVVVGVRADLVAFRLLAFQDFWRENAQMNRAPFEYNEAYPHIVLQAFLQRVLNGGGEIIREMALGKGALDLGVLFKGRKYAVEVKLRYLWDKNPDKALSQVRGYIDRLGVDEGWLVVFDPDMAKPWDEKISHEDRTVDGKPIHVFYC